MKRSNKEIENYLTSELSEMVCELKNGDLSEEGLYNYVSSILINADVDSRIVVNILEGSEFGEKGKEAALSIKVNEGW